MYGYVIAFKYRLSQAMYRVFYYIATLQFPTPLTLKLLTC